MWWRGFSEARTFELAEILRVSLLVFVLEVQLPTNGHLLNTVNKKVLKMLFLYNGNTCFFHEFTLSF